MNTGRYKSPEEVIRGALSLLRAYEELSKDETAQLRAQIAVGLEQADRGEREPWDAAEIEAEVERRFAEEQRGS